MAEAVLGIAFFSEVTPSVLIQCICDSKPIDTFGEEIHQTPTQQSENEDVTMVPVTPRGTKVNEKVKT
jgi:hypothetical protein